MGKGKINIGDTWKDVANIKINVGDVWKDVTKGFINIGDVWKVWYTTEQLLLDTYPGAIAIFSLRKLTSTYNGPCLRVRRSSDNATLDVYFIDNELDTQSIITFCGTGIGYVNIWYNQTGTNNLVSDTYNQQPLIFSYGVIGIYTHSNLSVIPCVKFQGTYGINTENILTPQSDGYWSAFTIASWNGATGQSIIDGDNEGGRRIGQYIRTDTGYPSNIAFNGGTPYGDNAGTTPVKYGVPEILTSMKYPNYVELFRNGYTNGATSMVALNTSTITNNKLGVGCHCESLTVQPLNGGITEVIFYPNNQYANFNNIQNDMMTYYNVGKFLKITGITDTTIINALKTLVLDLHKSYVWHKLKAVYPLVGGTADTHKYNLKDPRDLNASFRITWNGTVTHNSNGITGSANGEGVTNFNTNSNLTINSSSFGFYNRTNSYSEGVDMGILATTRMGTWSKHTNGYMMSDHYIDTQRVQYNLSTNPNTKLIISNRTSSTVLNIWQNGTKLSTQPASNVTSIPNGNMCILSQNGSAFSPRNLSFAFIGEGLTDADCVALNNAINTFQTTLGRNV